MSTTPRIQQETGKQPVVLSLDLIGGGDRGRRRGCWRAFLHEPRHGARLRGRRYLVEIGRPVRENHHIGVHTSSLRLNEDVVGVPLNMHLSGAKRDVFYRFRDLDNRHVVEGGRNNFDMGLGVAGRQKHSG